MTYKIMFLIILLYLLWALYQTYRQMQLYRAILKQGIPLEAQILGYEKQTTASKLRGTKALHVEFTHEGQRYQSRLEVARKLHTGQADDKIAILVSPEHDYQSVLDARAHQFSYVFALIGNVIAILLLGYLLLNAIF